MPELLFAYGTLRKTHAAPEIAPVVKRLRRVGPARMAGRLFDLGEFPAAVPRNGDRKSFVVGEVYELPADPGILSRLDAYEGFDPRRPAQSLFKRQRRIVTLASGRRVSCWAYLYNRKPGALSAIPHGDYDRLKSRRA